MLKTNKYVEFQKILVFFQGTTLFSLGSVLFYFDGLERITSPGRKSSAVLCVTPISETTGTKQQHKHKKWNFHEMLHLHE